MPLLSVEDVTKTHRNVHRDAPPALRGVSLALEAGECMAVWGERASGKTTLLKVVAGLQSPDTGVVWLAGEDVHGAHGDADVHAPLLAGPIGWVGAGEVHAEGLQALDCVALPLMGASCPPRLARARAWETLGSVGMARRAQVRCERLSGLERVLTSIAQAIAHEPRLLLADDPAGHLPAFERESVMALLRRLTAERSLAVLVAVSDMASMVWAHRVASLAEGRLLAPEPLAPRHDNVIDLRGRRYAVR